VIKGGGLNSRLNAAENRLQGGKGNMIAFQQREENGGTKKQEGKKDRKKMRGQRNGMGASFFKGAFDGRLRREVGGKAGVNTRERGGNSSAPSPRKRFQDMNRMREGPIGGVGIVEGKMCIIWIKYCGGKGRG